MSDRYVSVNLNKLEVMKQEWESIVIDRGLALGKLKAELHKQETVPVAAVVDFYNAVLAFGKAGGVVEMLEGLITDLEQGNVRQSASKADDDIEPHAEGTFRL